MNPELVAVVKERIDLGYSDEKITRELLEAGYTKEIVAQVIDTARNGIVRQLSDIPKDKLPSATSLVKGGFAFIFKRYDLVLLLSMPLVLISLLEYLGDSLLDPNLNVEVIVGLGSFFAVIGYLLILVSTLYIVSFAEDREVPFGEAFKWACSNVFGFIWINILSSLIVFGGFALLIIPGILVSMYLYFSQFVFAIEERKGMDALLRSRELMMGRWISVTSQIAIFYLIIILIFILLGVVVGLIASLVPTGAETDFVFEVLMQIMGATFSILGLYVGASLYLWLAARHPIVVEKITPGKKSYSALAVLGLASSVLLIASFAYLYAIHGEEYFLLEEGSASTEEIESDDTSAKERALELRNESEISENVRE